MIPSGTKVVVKIKNKWFVATISDKFKLIRKKAISKLSDVKDDGVVTLNYYIKKMNIDKSPEDIINTLKCDSLYVFYVEDDKPNQSWDKYWWKDKNKICLSCKNKCKQSSRVEIINCNQYEEE